MSLCFLIVHVIVNEEKLDSELLRDFVHSLREVSSRIPKKRLRFQLASEADSFRLSGYAHNAVTPFGMTERVPVIVCKRITQIPYNAIFLGGGDVNVKLGLSVSDLIRSTGAIVGEISHPRDKSKSSDQEIDE